MRNKSLAALSSICLVLTTLRLVLLVADTLPAQSAETLGEVSADVPKMDSLFYATWISQGSLVGGGLFMLALIPMSRYYLRGKRALSCTEPG